MKILMFEMTLEVAEEFYRRCQERKAETEEARTLILVELAEEGRMKSVIETKRTADQVVKDMAKNFGKVLYVSPKKKKKK